MPHLPAALARLLEEYPGEDGLARSERQALALLRAGPSTPARLFAACGRAETAPFMGDVVFKTRLLGLAGAGLVTPFEGWQAPIAATAQGLRVLAGRARAPVRAGWIGGVTLGGSCPWH